MDHPLVASQPAVRSGGPFLRRFRPPTLTLPVDRKTNTVIELESPIVVLTVDDDAGDDDSSSSQSSSASSSLIDHLSPDTHSDPVPDDITKDLADLERLGKNVRKNLRLRPIRSSGSLPNLDVQRSPFNHSPAWRDSPSSMVVQSPVQPSATPSIYFTPLSCNLPSPIISEFNISMRHADLVHTTNTPLPPQQAQPLDPGALYDRLTSPKRPLLIDARPSSSHVASHLKHSINIALPSLFLKRCKKPGWAHQSFSSLRQFITTEQGKVAWDNLIRPDGPWDNDVVIYDDDVDKDVFNSSLIPVISPLLIRGTIYYLKGGISAARSHSGLLNLISSGGDLDFGGDSFQNPSQIKKGTGLFQLDVESAEKSKLHPPIVGQQQQQPASTPLPSVANVVSSTLNNIIDSSPSPPPSQIVFHRPRQPPRRPSAPNLCRIDTKSAERLNTSLPKLQLRTMSVKSATLTVPPLRIAVQPLSPTHLSLVQGDSPPSSATCISPLHQNGSDEFDHPPLTSYYTPPLSPCTPMPMPKSPATARPELDQPPTTEEHPEEFVVSAILPNFLFLGPELITQDHLDEILDLGIKRILNMASECDDDKGLRLREVFDRYVKIPWRDTVEEENIARGVREVCDILDDARLHSAPTYVHCRAGKSRSVTAVMAYLIHANHWTLSQAYAFVVERRKGISPNIGFVSELMTFEEEELGGKSNGVQPPTSGDQTGDHNDGAQSTFAVASNRRPSHIRESLPPIFVTQSSDGNFGYTCPMSADPMSNARVGDSGQEMEIKDSSGRYRHARRAPVDEQTLQPLRRVSKAGLESALYF